MNAPKITLMSVAEFLAWEAAQDEKWELVDGVPRQRRTRLMAGGTARHARLAANAIGTLFSRLRGGPCAAYTSDLKVRAADAVRYPDVTVDCGAPGRSLLADKPVVLIEVLSPSTSTFQQTRLLADYQSIDTVRQIIFLSQDGYEAQSWVRGPGGWALLEHQGVAAVIEIAALGLALPMAELYDGVSFDEAATDPA